MKGRTFRILIILALMLFLVPQANAKRKNRVKAMGGATISPFGFIMDASYDPRLDKLVPGYKVINVIMINESFNIIQLDVTKDKWWVRLAGSKKKIPAVNALRTQKPGVWSALPEKVKSLMGYPLIIPIGGKMVFDIIVPESHDLSMFNGLSVYFRSLHTQIELTVSQ